MTPLRQVTYPYKVEPDQYATGGACFVAEHPDLEGCFGYGATRDEAIDKLAIAREAYLASLRAAGEPLPVPTVQSFTLTSGNLMAFADFRVTGPTTRQQMVPVTL
jgi:predicted RNase H-like HicB family nuclease